MFFHQVLPPREIIYEPFRTLGTFVLLLQVMNNVYMYFVFIVRGVNLLAYITWVISIFMDRLVVDLETVDGNKSCSALLAYAVPIMHVHVSLNSSEGLKVEFAYLALKIAIACQFERYNSIFEVHVEPLPVVFGQMGLQLVQTWHFLVAYGALQVGDISVDHQSVCSVLAE